MKELYRLIVQDAPSLFLFNEKYTLYAHSPHVGIPQDTFAYDVGVDYWWIRPEKEK
jgi:hypothetical protein